MSRVSLLRGFEMTEMKYTVSKEGIKLYNYRWVIIACMFIAVRTGRF